jgi:predicted phage terminase large subunit-like protein
MSLKRVNLVQATVNSHRSSVMVTNATPARPSRPSSTNPLTSLDQRNRSLPKTQSLPSSDSAIFPSYTQWLKTVTPEYNWDWAHLDYIRDRLADVTLGVCRKLAISIPPQHCKTESVTVRYPLWRMLREPGIRVGIACYNQNYTAKQSRKTRKIARGLGLEFGETVQMGEWSLANGSTFVARGAGVGIAGEPLDLLVIDDPFKNRKEADSPTIQERVYEWYMDDVTPRIQKAGAIIIIHTRWGANDLIGNIQKSAEARDWRYVRLSALAETQEERDKANAKVGLPAGLPDPLNRLPGEALCPDRYPQEELEGRRRVEGIGFETVYQQNETARGGNFFQRDWFPVVDRLPANAEFRIVRYWDLAASRADSACYTSGVLMAKVGRSNPEYYILDVVRDRWASAERNEMMRSTAMCDKTRPGFERTWFEKPVFDKKNEASRAIQAKLMGFPFGADNVSGQGSKELRAEPLADAAKAGFVKLLAGAWNSAFLTELEGFPKTQYKDQVDSAAGAFAKLNFGAATVSVNGERI